MILGLGHDILEIDRIGRLLDGKSRERYLQRILTPRELALLQQYESRSLEWVAGRFAAKEAVVKAFGCGIGSVLGFQDIEVLPAESGKPYVELSRSGWKRLGLEAEHTRIHISISHQPHIASAVCVVEQ
ncbi:holo-ACP synthase [Paenibacillus arenosi]|uniref:Holo-[acyl-carrier-protein] synthase n=1 Tax=Paenibacillus arenosi TaxID=2774142 RepID=A0ABR9B3H4_9BACL|nr:holo-ACP synthase [Paenibacillus arenosi]MBD8500543.1 holo-ACP synthase [Paenibacillus arenosi]